MLRSSPEMFSGQITREYGNLSNHVIDLQGAGANSYKGSLGAVSDLWPLCAISTAELCHTMAFGRPGHKNSHILKRAVLSWCLETYLATEEKVVSRRPR